MNRKQKIIVSITGIFLVLIILVGLTYAYFLTKITGNTNSKSITVTTANLVLEYGENTNVVQGISNAEPGYSVEKIFTATNKGNSTVTYGAALESIVNGLTRQEDLVYTLTCTSYLKEGFSLASNGTITGTVDGTCNGVSTEKQFPSTSTLSLMTTNTIDTTHTHAYKLTVTYKEMNVDQSTDMNKTFSAKVNIVDLRASADKINPYSANKNALNYQIVNSALEGNTTFMPNLSAIGLVRDGETAEGRILSTAEDDYGTSYYFRGSPIDNYVNFAGMCWRIVRIEGDGSIKLILASEKICSTTNLTNSSGYATDGVAGTQGTILTANYGYKNVGANSKTYQINDYINSAADTIENARTKLNAWLERKITNESDKVLLKNETWCIGDQTNGYIDVGHGNAIIGRVNYLINSGTSFEFTAGNKYNITETPSYKCETTGVDGEIDINKVGMLTFDEIIFAGGGNYVICYLNDNATTNHWWSISPESFLEDMSYSFFAYDDCGVSNGAVTDFHSLRPAVTLKSNTQISGGNGTITNPYIIQ